MTTTDRQLSGSGTPPRARSALAMLAIAAPCALLALMLLAPARALMDAAQVGYGTQALTSLVLMATALTGAVLCGYLALVHALAAIVTLRGARGSGSPALLAVLRVLAPRLASRAVATLAVTTAAAGLLAGPAQALEATAPVARSGPSIGAPLMRLPSGQDGRAGADSTDAAEGAAAPRTVLPSDRRSAEHGSPAEHESTEDASPTAPDADDDDAADPLPDLGWGAPGTGSAEEGAPEEPRPSAPAPSPTSDAGSDADDPAGPSAPTRRTVVVSSGDSLWSISDDLLGEGPDPAAQIAAAWPRLYAENADRIGADPGHIETGQVLVVPDSLPTLQEK
jgi:hypothetical protein